MPQPTLFPETIEDNGYVLPDQIREFIADPEDAFRFIMENVRGIQAIQMSLGYGTDKT